jgi:hypothetical protein
MLKIDSFVTFNSALMKISGEGSSTFTNSTLIGISSAPLSKINSTDSLAASKMAAGKIS